MTCITNYNANLNAAIFFNPSFKAICEFNVNHYQKGWYEQHKYAIANGTGQLTLSEEMVTYLAAYGEMHLHKLNQAYAELFKDKELEAQSIEVIDWGCGQAFASCALIDYVREHNINLDIIKFYLIEPSPAGSKLNCLRCTKTES